jgi:hypothetical protein
MGPAQAGFPDFIRPLPCNTHLTCVLLRQLSACYLALCQCRCRDHRRGCDNQRLRRELLRRDRPSIVDSAIDRYTPRSRGGMSMDGQRFDWWTRALASAPSRRGFLRGFAGMIIGGGFAASVDDAEAASSCQICRRGRCAPRPDGTRCASCGVCLSGACVPDAENPCGACKQCSAATLRCVNRPNSTACGSCGSCVNGSCRSNADACPECARCQRSVTGYSCSSGCSEGQRCCANNECVGADACCADETKCGDECCDRRTETCTAEGCCPRDDVCGSGSNAECCGQAEECLRDSGCCPTLRICRSLESGSEICCSEGELCCPSDNRCKPPSECCDPECSLCETCERGQCVQIGDGSRCTDNSGVCCSGDCRIGEVCCVDTDCSVGAPECGTCVDGQCDRTAKNGQTCGTTGCQVCLNGDCVNQTDNHACTSGSGVCCQGACCEGNSPICCGGTCCTTLLCISDFCCIPGSGFATADASLCCPFGPPCGATGSEECCDEGELCCNGTCKTGCGSECCDNPGDTCCNFTCCPDGKHCCGGTCQDRPCDCDQLCQDGTCCSFGSGCSNEGCCVYANGKDTCYPFGDQDGGPCCDTTTESCCREDVDSWCCPAGLACYPGGRCCPAAYPIGAFNDEMALCCEPGANPFQEPERCVSTTDPGRHA